MKKVILADKLDFNKEIIANLTEEQLREIEGGVEAESFSCILFSKCKTKAIDEEETA